MKKEREVMRLARANLGLEEIAARMQVSQEAILNSARRMGIYFKPPDTRRKAKASK